jgi:hypothetical protein
VDSNLFSILLQSSGSGCGGSSGGGVPIGAIVGGVLAAVREILLHASRLLALLASALCHLDIDCAHLIPLSAQVVVVAVVIGVALYLFYRNSQGTWLFNKFDDEHTVTL